MSIQKAIDKAGGVVRLSEKTGKSVQVIVNWRSRGVPPKEVIPVCRSLDWGVLPHDIDPELYPNHLDGVPPGVFDQSPQTAA